MKKVLSIVLALVLAITSLGAGTAVFAKENELYTKVEAQMKNAGEYLVENTKDMSSVGAIDFLTLLKSGYDMSKYSDSFVSSIKENLDKNSGKLIVSGENWYENSETHEWYSVSYSYEDIGFYGAAISSLELLGYNPKNFEGYNVVSAFEDIDLENGSFNPYYYRPAIEAADKDFAKALCNDLISKYYDMGSGLNYWGYSCDNTAYFLTAIANYKDDYKSYVEDAKKVIKSYTLDNGAFADFTYVTEVNADSTALAMMAYSSIGDAVTANWYYNKLVSGFEGSKSGIFTYYGNDDFYATKDALLGLEYYSNVIKNVAQPKTISLSSSSYIYSGNPIKPRVTVKDSNNKEIASSNYDIAYSNNKKVGTATVTIKFKGIYYGTIKKTFKINPKKTSISKVTAKSKSFTVKWKKQATQTTGYQIQYATNSKFTKNKKTVTVSKNKTTSKTVKKLKAKKKYYVRIRTYKTVDGKKYYSGWSSVKTVKTKK